MKSGVSERRLCLLGWAWHDGSALGSAAHVDGAASSPMLFMNLRAAQAWCRGKHNYYALSGNEICKGWRFRPVRVLDRTEVIK